MRRSSSLRFFSASALQTCADQQKLQKQKIARKLSLAQKSQIINNRRDHKSFRVNLGGEYGIACGNDMMQATIRTENGVPRGNTGFFDFSETEIQYQERLIRIADDICADIHENTIAVMRQEFAIKPHHIKIIVERIKSHQLIGWENPELHITAFGVMTCFKGDVYKAIFHKDESLDAALAELSIRCQVFKSSDSYAIANTHIPFRDTKKAFKEIVHTLLTHDLDKSLSGRFKCVDFIGDKNLDPETQIELTEAVFNEVRLEREKTGQKPITLLSYLVSSPQGHQQQKNGKPVLVNVDSCQRFVMFESNEYEFHSVTADPADSGYRYILSLLLGGGVITATLSDDATFALTEIAVMEGLSIYKNNKEKIDELPFSMVFTQ
ncbi:MAG: hypothetical protein COY58_03940 [Gammaproteobacteria bacterium CG_4_10_14_0_8_um_filter_38_16]|nr:MAG: hypothetical protein COY58_03940 [Gammaproteobacteria bacterium CG_4_10_14_0_8_um_filter_38_16]PJA03212.1 MAG: hypothetical protein COX72_06465 [Gammaproteobacteria bacterium CG_4_10_14_0_2_um_filter_38_22]PJB10331.1 MAG: hypothetical protein CO120_05360 [Gammaproteobacteria bacterium CG_4_9_14_3_um_filter_38_9]